tara:strand:+ start:1626 stop:4409 length:2784 start_codon:yes stop_codon:yes gene_type:complete
MARVEIEGIGVVEVDDSFRDLSEADQQKTLSEIRDASLNKPSSFSQLVGAPIRGFNVGALADTLGAPVDLTNFLIKSVDKASEMIGGPFIDEDLFVPPEKPFLGSEFIKDALVATGSGYRDEADLPVDQRALSRGGRTAGQVMTSTVPLFGAAGRMSPAQAMMKAPPGKSAVKQQFSEIVKSTARNPAKMAAIEGTSALGAGTLRAGAEAIDPGNEFLGMGAELLGGFAGPVPVARTAFNKAKGVAEGFTPRGREQAASRKVREILEQNQFLTKDPEMDERKLSNLVEQLRGAEGSATTAQVTQDPQARQALTAIENKLIADAGDELKTAIGTQTKKAADEFNKKVRKLNNSGNPLLVKEAQEMRIELSNKKIDSMVEKAEDKAVSAVNRVLTKNKDDAVKASSEARQIIDDELKLARKMETRLWDEVDKGVPSPTKKTIEAFNSIKDEISPNEQVMKPIEGFIQGLIKRKSSTLEQKPGRGFMATAQRQRFKPVVRVSAKELFRKRSVALNLARQAKATGRFNDARMLNKVADGMLEDLNQVTDVTANVAREFSRSLNEKFNTKLVRGLREAEPGVLLEKAGQASDAQRAFNFQALKRATERTVDTMETPRTTGTLNKLQRDFMESAAAEVIDPFTNQIKPAALSRFVDNNQLTLKEVGMLDDINDVDKKVKLATMLQQTATKGKAFIEKKSLAAQIARGSDNLSEVVGRAFDSNSQLDAFKDLSRTVKRSKNPEAFAGLRHGVFDELTKRATVKNGELEGLISGNNLEQLLNNKVGNKTLRQNLLDSGLITSEQSANLTKIINKAKVFEEAATDPRKLNTLISTGDGVINLLARLVGSRLGSMTASGQGSPFVMAYAGSKTAQKVLEKVPALKVQGVLTQAIQDPKFMADLLQKRAKPQKQLDTRMNAYLMQIGLIEVDRFEEDN